MNRGLITIIIMTLSISVTAQDLPRRFASEATIKVELLYDTVDGTIPINTSKNVTISCKATEQDVCKKLAWLGENEWRQNIDTLAGAAHNVKLTARWFTGDVSNPFFGELTVPKVKAGEDLSYILILRRPRPRRE